MSLCALKFFLLAFHFKSTFLQIKIREDQPEEPSTNKSNPCKIKLVPPRTKNHCRKRQKLYSLVGDGARRRIVSLVDPTRFDQETQPPPKRCKPKERA